MAGHLQPLTLRDVPLHIRRRYGRRLVDAAGDSLDMLAAVALTRAIEEPSETVYWLPAEAVRKVLR